MAAEALVEADPLETEWLLSKKGLLIRRGETAFDVLDQVADRLRLVPADPAGEGDEEKAEGREIGQLIPFSGQADAAVTRVALGRSIFRTGRGRMRSS